MNISISINNKSLSISETASWTAKGGLAVLDQGLFAGTNFITNLLLARWLAPNEYGAFALAYSVFLLFGTLYSSFLTDPMLVYGPGKYFSRLQQYLGLLLRGHFLISASLGIMLCTVALAVGRFYPMVGWALAGVALAAPWILLVWFARSAFYIESKPGWPAAGGAIYCAGLLAWIALLHAMGGLTPFSAIVAMGGAGLVVSALLLSRMRTHWRQSFDAAGTRYVAASHWSYGRWVAPSRATAWVPTNIYFAILPLWFGLSDAGALKALLNFSLPVIHTLTALGVLLLPSLIRSRSKDGRQGVTHTVHWFFALSLMGTIVYAALLWIFRNQALYLLYGEKYEHYSSLTFLLACLVPFGSCLAEPYSRALVAIERPDLMFKSSVAGGIVAIVLGVPLVAAFGLTGALAGVSVAGIVFGFMSYFYYKRECAAGASASPAYVQT
ncbi:MAG TPA: polysaccharide biosynthesis C-terminal domain-containing protein [Terriglobia bacterium]|nr:polysaccharide biosynthesis C-terminal domain-containing protein [Terriglobia bacterium]